MRNIALLTALAFALATVAARAAESGIVAPGATLEKLAGGFSFTEGTSADADGNVYFTDQPNDRILKWTTEGKLVEVMKPAGRSNGTKIDAGGHLVACADEKNELWSIDLATLKPAVLLKDYEGKLFNGPNDLWIRPDGGMYITDPYYKRDYWKRGAKEMPECVYFLSPDRSKLTRVIDDLRQPNGIIGTPDGKILYVADIGSRKTWAYDIQDDGSLKNKRPFCNLGSDGMTLDEQGNVYLTGQGVTVFDKAGKQIQRIAVPEGWCGNCCFGGKDRQTLFIAASKGFYGIRMTVKGAIFPKPAAK